MFSIIKMMLQMGKELIRMNFTVNSKIAQSYVILILAGIKTIEDVPNVGNLVAIVEEILTA